VEVAEGEIYGWSLNVAGVMDEIGSISNVFKGRKERENEESLGRG
jgi:hypothetical protein